MSEQYYAGSTSQSIDLFLQDSSSVLGAGLSGVVYDTSGLSAYYRKGQTGSSTQITLATQSVSGSYTSGGFVEIDNVNMKGLYRLDMPNAMIDTEGTTTLYMSGATNMVPVVQRIECRAFDVNVKKVSDDSTAADNLELQYDGNGLTGDTYPATQAQIGTSGDGLTDITLNAASIDLIWDEAITTSAHNGANSAGKKLRQASNTLAVESTVSDSSASATQFNTNLTSAVDDFYNDSVLTFLTGDLAGQSRPVLDYVGSTNTITVDEALTSIPASGVEFQIAAGHIHPISQIQSGLSTSGNLTSAKEEIIASGQAETSVISSQLTTLNNQIPPEAF